MSGQRKALAVFQWLARAGIAFMFLYAGVAKLAEPAQLASDMANYRLLPETWVPVLALFVPVFEVALALSLLLSPYLRGGALLSAMLLTVFAAAMAQAKLRGIDLECGCFGAAADARVSWIKVAQNVALATLAVWVAWSASRSAAEPRPEPPRTTAPGNQAL
jgi:uncharacterized membrane protein YphA (DoxX/SURF4 family)